MPKWRWDQNHFARCILEGLKRVHTKTLNYAKLTDTEQGEKRAPDKFLDRLQEALRKFTDWSQKYRGRNNLKDRFLTQSTPGFCHKLWKQAFGPNQPLKNCYSWFSWNIMVKNMGRKVEGKKPGKRLTPQQWLLDPLWNRLKSARSNRGEKGWTCFYGGKERHLKLDCPQASKRHLAPCPVYKMTTPEERLPSET